MFVLVYALDFVKTTKVARETFQTQRKDGHGCFTG